MGAQASRNVGRGLTTMQVRAYMFNLLSKTKHTCCQCMPELDSALDDLIGPLSQTVTVVTGGDDPAHCDLSLFWSSRTTWTCFIVMLHRGECYTYNRSRSAGLTLSAGTCRHCDRPDSITLRETRLRCTATRSTSHPAVSLCSSVAQPISCCCVAMQNAHCCPCAHAI